MNSKNEALEDLYTACMNCTVEASHCKVWKDIPGGVPPRGFSYTTAPVAVLVVGKNPGHPFQADPEDGFPGERELLRGKTGSEIFKAFQDFQTRPAFASPKNQRSSQYQKRLGRYLQYILNTNGSEHLLEYLVAHTNLVKCSTCDEQEKLSIDAMEECFERYLRREIDLFQPKIILTLGREAERFLRKKQHDGLVTTPIFYIKHPSYPWEKTKMSNALELIKTQVMLVMSGELQ